MYFCNINVLFNYLKSITPSLPEASKEQITINLVKLKELMLAKNFEETKQQLALVEAQLTLKRQLKAKSDIF